MDLPLTVRRYVNAHRPTPTPGERAQEERRWILEMALRGHDVGRTFVHGVRVDTAAGSGNAWQAAAA
ncbi:hypothetical protein [Streptomyces sp. NPDC002851]